MSARGDRFITPRSPVEGLSRRKLSFLPVFAQAVAAVAPAGAMAVIPALVFPGLVFGSAGPNLVLTFGAAMAVMVVVSFCLRPMAKRMAAVSGLYSYTAKGLGQRPAITVGWSAMFGYGLVAMASLLAVGTYVVQLLINLGVLSRIRRFLRCWSFLPPRVPPVFSWLGGSGYPRGSRC